MNPITRRKFTGLLGAVLLSDTAEHSTTTPRTTETLREENVRGYGAGGYGAGGYGGRSRTCPTVDGTRTTDPDGDGLCEDFNGNGRLDFDDVNRFFENINDSEVENNVESFDFNGNDRIDFDDVNTLFDEVS